MKRIISAIFVLVVLFSLAGCSSNNSNTPTATLNKFLTAVKNNDKEEINKHIDYDNFTNKAVFDKKENGDVYYSLLSRSVENLEFSLNDEVIKDDIATIKVTAKNVDMSNVIPDAVSTVLIQDKKTISKEDVKNSLDKYMDIATKNNYASVDISLAEDDDPEKEVLPTDKLDNERYKYETTFEVKLKKNNDDWEILFENDLFDELTGYYVSSVKSLIDLKMN